MSEWKRAVTLAVIKQADENMDKDEAGVSDKDDGAF